MTKAGKKVLIFQTTRTLIRRLCFTLYHASVQQKALIFVSQNMIVFIVYDVEKLGIMGKSLRNNRGCGRE